MEALSAVLQPRVEVLNDITEQTQFLAQMPEYDIALYENAKMKTTPEIAKNTMKLAYDVLAGLSVWDNETLFSSLKEAAAANGFKNGQILYPLRVALSGLQTTPGGATEIAVVLGKSETLNRINIALAKL